MKMQFSGFENLINIACEKISVLEIDNKVLFTRVCQSLVSQQGEFAIEPYLLWDDAGTAMKAKDAFLMLPDPLNLPWGD